MLMNPWRRWREQFHSSPESAHLARLAEFCHGAGQGHPSVQSRSLECQGLELVRDLLGVEQVIFRRGDLTFALRDPEQEAIPIAFEIQLDSGELIQVGTLQPKTFTQNDFKVAQGVATVLATASAKDERPEAKRTETILSALQTELKPILVSLEMNASVRAKATPEQSKMSRSLQRAKRLISELIDPSKIEQGEIGLDKSPQNPVDLLDRAISQVKADLPDSPPQIELRSGGQESGCSATCDGDRITLSLVVLLEEFARSGRKVELEHRFDGKNWRLSMVSPDENALRARPAAVKERRETLARTIVAAHGGSLEISEHNGAWSRAELSLPAIRARERVPATRQKLAEIREKMKKTGSL